MATFTVTASSWGSVFSIAESQSCQHGAALEALERLHGGLRDPQHWANRKPSGQPQHASSTDDTRVSLSRLRGNAFLVIVQVSHPCGKRVRWLCGDLDAQEERARAGSQEPAHSGPAGWRSKEAADVCWCLQAKQQAC